MADLRTSVKPWVVTDTAHIFLARMCIAWISRWSLIHIVVINTSDANLAHTNPLTIMETPELTITRFISIFV
jgi:hypothetical protein